MGPSVMQCLLIEKQGCVERGDADAVGAACEIQDRNVHSGSSTSAPRAKSDDGRREVAGASPPPVLREANDH